MCVMDPIAFSAPGHGRALSATLKAVRRRRGLTAAQTAAAMAMPLRSYEHFESGAGRLDLEKIARFAEALAADPFAILVAVQIGSPEFAARSADNKAMFALLIRLEEFAREMGDRLADLDAALVLSEMGEALDRMAQEVKRRGRLYPEAPYFP